jgi:hypothetical protein
VKTRACLPAHLSHLNLICNKQHDLYIYSLSDEFFYRADSMVIRLKSTCPAKKRNVWRYQMGIIRKRIDKGKRTKRIVTDHTPTLYNVCNDCCVYRKMYFRASIHISVDPQSCYIVGTHMLTNVRWILIFVVWYYRRILVPIE